ncbi:exonuclease RNase T and DNA polymerase III [Athelia psychrophila]|uniref:Exonuclease RNase T and DNA polymerase III n=1 Tax=Athelia psychrophila TaxID=1759441 RepID=A0A166U322_9AGAM|nr:exonuclease RNase T and DNA polymerase III [Fibularhizoctonia sp. CBS 109695]
MSTRPTRSRLEYLLVLDFEATCGGKYPKGEFEIIEFPTLLYNLSKNSVQAQFHEYVKPIGHPALTEFCTELTGIEQATVDAADPFPVVWTRFQEWLQSVGALDKPADFAFVTCGDWDLKTMLPAQLAYTNKMQAGFSQTTPLPLDCWINIKHSFASHYQLPGRGHGMKGMLKHQKLALEGRHHSGIDDCKNIARIVTKMRKQKWVPVDDLPKAS